MPNARLSPRAGRTPSARRPQSTQSGGSSGRSREPPRRGLLGSLFSPPAGGQQRPNRPDPNALPPDDGAGRRALLIALVLAGLATVALAFLPVPVDSEGEPLSRDELDELNDNDESYDSDPGFSAIGPLVFVSGLPTIVAAGFALRGLTRPRRSRTLMICLLMAAVAVLLTAGGGLSVPSGDRRHRGRALPGAQSRPRCGRGGGRIGSGCIAATSSRRTSSKQTSLTTT